MRKISTSATGSRESERNTSSTLVLWSKVELGDSRMQRKMLLMKTSICALRCSLKCAMSATKMRSDNPTTCVTEEVQFLMSEWHR